MNERVRTTISIEPEVLETFTAMAAAAGISVSRCMGDWLRDTSEGAQFVTQKLQDVRRSPVDVMLTYETERREAAAVPGLRSNPARRPRHDAPASNTGLKSPRQRGSSGKPA